MAETITLENKALVCYGEDKIEVRSIPLTFPKGPDGNPVIPANNVLVKVRATGICGSDIHMWKEGTDSIPPYVLGHECAGEIIGLGDQVSGWKIGDRVAIKPGGPCRTCDYCTTGQANMCPDDRYFGVPGCDGSCCTLKIVPEAQLCPLTDKISWTESGLIQPLAIAMQMTRQAGLKAHQHVLILGGGCIGLMLGAMAKAFGAAKVVVLEKEPHRTEFAKTYCADQVFVNPPREKGEITSAYATRVSKHISANVCGLQRGGFDVCIEACGAEETMQMGIMLAKHGGTYVQVGLYMGQHPEIPMIQVVSKQLTIKGTFRYTTNCFEQAVDLVDRGVVDVKSLVSHVYQFEDILDAFEATHKVQDKQGKKLLKSVILHGEDDHPNGSVLNGH
jgi:D-xylulose reductase